MAPPDQALVRKPNTVKVSVELAKGESGLCLPTSFGQVRRQLATQMSRGVFRLAHCISSM